MGLPGLASQQDEHDGAIVDVIGLINASYDLIGLIRDLQRSKRQREDHAQQLLHDLQRSQVFVFVSIFSHFPPTWKKTGQQKIDFLAKFFYDARVPTTSINFILLLK